MTTHQIINAIELDVRFPRRVGCKEVARDFAVATYEELPGILEKHIDPLVKRLALLEEAIKTHRSQKADDRCIEDDDRLYEALGDGIKCDRRVGDKAAMLKNCKRFIENRCEAGGWPTYAELEQRIKEWEIHFCPTGTDVGANIDACKAKAKARGVPYLFMFNYDKIYRVFPDGSYDCKQAGYTDKL